MPKLPCGMSLELSIEHIPDPGFQWFPCPPGHFWYQTPDLSINKPPFTRGVTIICDIVHAPVPETIEEAEKYIQVVHVDEDTSEYWWEGDWLDSFRPKRFRDADWRQWRQWQYWRDSQADFLDRTIQKCRAQAEANCRTDGTPPVFHAMPAAKSELSIRSQIDAIGRGLKELELPMDRAFAKQDEQAAAVIFRRLQEMLAQAEKVSMQAGPDAAAALHVRGIALRMLKEHDKAEQSFREALRLAPFKLDTWLELTWCCAEQGKLADAEAAARRAVEIDTQSAAAWGNLAMTLVQLQKRAEARQAIDRALVLDPTDVKNSYIAANFDLFMWEG